jgi:hypothetical protein
VRPLTDEQLDTLGAGASPLGVHGQHVLLDGELDRIGRHAGEVELDDELVATAVGVDGHRRRPGRGSQRLLGESVEFAERIGTHQHREAPFSVDGRPNTYNSKYRKLSTPVVGFRSGRGRR